MNEQKFIKKILNMTKKYKATDELFWFAGAKYNKKGKKRIDLSTLEIGNNSYHLANSSFGAAMWFAEPEDKDLYENMNEFLRDGYIESYTAFHEHIK